MSRAVEIFLSTRSSRHCSYSATMRSTSSMTPLAVAVGSSPAFMRNEVPMAIIFIAVCITFSAFSGVTSAPATFSDDM